jgi:hypothetical protein
VGRALHDPARATQIDPKLKLGGPIFTGQNEDVRTWPDANGNTSWTARFIDYLRTRGKLSELSFFSFEHYPIDAGKIAWSSLYDEARWVTHIMQVWREDGVPPAVPLFIAESNISPQYSEGYMDLWGGGSQGTFNFFSADKDLKVKQPLAQYFASQLINLEWLQPGSGQHRLFAATGDVTDGVGHLRVTYDFYPAPASITVLRGKVAMRAPAPLRP